MLTYTQKQYYAIEQRIVQMLKDQADSLDITDVTINEHGFATVYFDAYKSDIIIGIAVTVPEGYVDLILTAHRE